MWRSISKSCRDLERLGTWVSCPIWQFVLCLMLLALVPRAQGTCTPCPDVCECPGTSPNCSTLDCTGQNLTFIPGSVDVPVGITHLKLGNNDLGPDIPIGFFQNFTDLIFLNLTNNGIATLDNSIFKTLSRLEVLDLRYNDLTSLHPTILAGQGHLSYLNIAYNSISTIDSTLFDELTSLKSVYIGSNPLHCDCTLRPFKLWVKKSIEEGVNFPDNTSINCVSPIETHILSSTSQNFVCDSLNYTSCVMDSKRGYVIPATFQNISTQHDNREECNKHCFIQGSTLAAISSNPQIEPNRIECFCGIQIESYTSCSCSHLDTKSDNDDFCGGLYISDSFLVTANLTLSPIKVQSVLDILYFNLNSLFPMDTYIWDFGDSETMFMTSTSSSTYAYSFPGEYNIHVTATLSGQNESLDSVVRIVAPLEAAIEGDGDYISSNGNANVHATVVQGSDVRVSWTRYSEDGERVEDKSCEIGWSMDKARCFYISDTSLGFESASKQCTLRDATLATFPNKGQMQHFLRKAELDHAVYVIDAVKHEDVYRWNSTGVDTYFEAPGLNGTGQCIGINGSTGLLVPLNCTAPHRYICVKDAVECPLGGSLFSNDMCYLLVKEPQTWEESFGRCFEMNGSLAVLDKPDVYQFVTENVFRDSGVNMTWLGLQRRSQIGESMWNNGQPLDINLHRQNVFATNSSQMCGFLTSTSHNPYYVISNQPCAEVTNYICQYPNGASIPEVPSDVVDIADELLVNGSTTSLDGALVATKQMGTRLNTVLLPGTWFRSNGVLTAIRFTTGLVKKNTTLHIHIYRPGCTETKQLISPGCDNSGYQYSACLDKSDCKYLKSHDCNSSHQYCHLSNTCQLRNIPCNCNNITCPSISHEDIHPKLPFYSVQGAYSLEVLPGNQTTYTAKLPQLRLQENDIIGFQYGSSGEPVLCIQNSQSKWRQNILIQKLPEIFTINDVLPATVFNWKYDIVCHIQIFYGKTYAFSPPAYMLEDNLRAGRYIYSAKIYSIEKVIEKNVSILVEDSITRLSIVHPMPKKNNVYIERNVSTTLLIKINRGTNVTGQINDLSVNYIFVPHCPTELHPYSECSSRKKNEQFIWEKYLLKNIERITLSIKATNNVSSRINAYVLHSQDAIKGVTIMTNHSTGAILLHQNLEFIGKVTAGTDPEFTWYIDSNLVHTNSSPVLKYFFSSSGNHNISLVVSNGVSSTIKTLEVRVLQEANMSNLVIKSGPRWTEPNAQIAITFSFQVERNANISYTIDYDDGTIEQYDIPETSTDLYFEFTHMYEYTFLGCKYIRITTNDLYSELTVHHIIHVLVLLEDVHLIGHPTHVATNQTVNMTAIPKNNCSACTYTFIFNGATFQDNANATAAYSFTEPGYFVISTVVIDNGNIVGNASVNITVDEPVQGLTLNYTNKIILPYDSLEFTIISWSFNRGTNVLFNISSDEGTPDVIANDSSSKTYIFTKQGVYKVNVTAYNKVHSESAIARIDVIDPQNITALKIVPIPCQMIDTDVQFEAVVENHNSSQHEYAWDFGENLSVNGTGKVTTNHTYSKIGVYKVIVTVTSKTMNRSASTTVCIEQPVNNFILEADEPVALNQSSLNANTTITAKDYECINCFFKWSHDGNTITLYDVPTFVFNIQRSGVHEIRLTIYNNISSHEESIKVNAEDVIEGAKLISEPSEKYFSINAVVKLSISIPHGSNVECEWTMGTDRLETSLFSHYYMFRSLGVIKASVECNNRVSRISDSTNFIIEGPVRDAVFNQSSYNLITGTSLTLRVDTNQGATDLEYNWAHCLACSSFQSINNTVSFSFSTAGEYTIAVDVANHVSSSKANTKIIVYEEIVIEGIHSSYPSFPFIPTYKTVEFSVNITRGSNAIIEWTFSDASIALSPTSDVEVTHAFNRTGNFTITVRISNDVSQQEITQIVSAQEILKEFDISANHTVASVGQMISFVASSTFGSDLQYTWDFGDGTIKEGDKRYIHAYMAPGLYTIKATAKNQISSSSKQINVDVLEPISSLDISNCCKRVYQADTRANMSVIVNKGTRVNCQWTITSPNLNETNIDGKNIKLDLSEEGIYELMVNCSNGISSLVTNRSLVVQTFIESVNMFVHGDERYLYANHPIYFSAIVQNGGRDTRYRWMTSDSPHIWENFSKVFLRIFLSNGTHTVNVTAYNNISSAFNSMTISTQYLQCSIPRLAVVGGISRRALRSRRIHLEVNIASNDCTAYEVRHSWRLYDDIPSCLGLANSSIVLPESYDSRSPILRLPAWFLDYGHYCIEFKSSYVNTPLKSTAYFELEIISSQLKALIKGGDERQLWEHDRLTLDGTESYDPDQPPNVEQQLTYIWTCRSKPKVTPALASTVTSKPLQIFDDGCFKMLSGPLHIFPMETFIGGRDYYFNMTVSQSVIGRSTTVTQKVTVELSPVLSVNIGCISCKVTDTYKISRSSSIKLIGSCDNCGPNVRYLWSVHRIDGKDVKIDETTSTTGANRINFVLRRDIIDNSFAYIFKLKIDDLEGGKEGYSSLTLHPNEPPYGGACSVSPRYVIAMESKVNATCSGWKDAADNKYLPLLYTITVERFNGDQNNIEGYTLYHGPQSSHNLYLSSWPESGGNSVQLVIKVADQYGASTIGLNQTLIIDKGYTDDFPGGYVNYLHQHVPKKFVELRRMNDPVTLLQYATGLCMQLNKETLKASRLEVDNDVGKRSSIRDEISMALNDSCPVQNIEDVKPIAYLLTQLTMYTEEYQNRTCQIAVSDILDRFMNVIDGINTQGLSSEDMNTYTVLSTMSNLMQAVNYRHYIPHNITQEANSFVDPYIQSADTNLTTGEDDMHRERIVTNVLNMVDVLATRLLMTQLLDETMATETVPGLHLRGQRVLAQNILRDQLASGCHIKIPSDFLQQHRDSEVFQIISVSPINPYTWGFSKNFEISTFVPALVFKYANGTEINVKNNHEDFYIAMPESWTVTGEPVPIPSPSITHSPTTGVVHSNTTLRSSETQALCINTTLDVSNASLHIQVLFNVIDNQENLTDVNFYVVALYAAGYQPTDDEYDIMQNISILHMEPNADHRNYTIFQRSYDPSVQHYVTITNPHSDVSLNISIGYFFSSCQYFNTTSKKWQTDGCYTADLSTPMQTICSCNHLTSFGGGVFIPEEILSFETVVRMTSGTNVVTIVTSLMIVVIYLAAMIVAKRWDLLDLHKIGVVPLCGKDGVYRYEITVYTGMRRGAGTTAHIGMKLYGCDSSSSAFHLSKPSAFKRNGRDSMLVATEKCLGDIWKISIWHDNTGLSPSWYLSHVEARDISANKSYLFRANCWLSLQHRNGELKKKLRVSDPKEVERFTWAFRSEFARGLAERHAWLSVFERRAQSRYTRVQRLTCSVTYLLMTMAAIVLWYGVLAATMYPETLTDIFTGKDILVAVVSALVAMPLNILLVQMFRKSRCKISASDLNNITQTAVEMDAMCEMSQPGSECGSGILKPHIGLGLHRSDPIHHGYLDNNNSDAIQQYIIDKNRLRRTSSDTGSSLYDRILRWSDKPSNLWKDDDCSSREQSARSRRSLMANRKISVQSSEFCESPIPINEDTDDYKIDKHGTETGKTFDSRQMQRRRRMGVYSKDEGLGPDILNTTESNDNTTPSSEIENGLHSEEQEAELSRMEKNKSESNSECSHTNNNNSSENENQSSESGIFTRSSDSSSINDIVDQELQKAFSPAICPESDKRRSSRGQRGEKVSWTELPPKISDFIPRHPISTLKRRFSNLTASTATQFTSKGYLKRTTNDNKCQLPSWCVYLAYILCFVLASLSIGVIIGVGHSFTVTIATKWALAVIIATSISALVLESLKVLIIAVLLAIMKRGTTLSDDDVEISPLIESNETIKDLKCRPVGGFALHHAREEAEKLRRMHALLRQFVVYVLFIWLVMVVNYVDNHTERYRLSESLKNQITHPQNLSQRFTTIKRKDEFWNWLHHGIVDSIYNESEPSENAYTFVLGPPRLLQTRSKNVKCKATSAVPPLNAASITQRPCYGSHTWVESTEHYGIGWNSSISRNYTWRYSTQGDTETYGMWGEWGWYNGGGYVQLLPLSSDEAHHQLNTLEKQNWVDRGTRAVITEYTVYNNNRDLYSSVRLLAEFSLTGEVISSIDIQVVSYQKFILGKINATLICQMLLIAVVLYLCGYIIMSIIEEKKLYFTHLSNWLDLAIVTSATATIVLYIYNMVNSTNLFSRYTSNTGSFMSLSWLANGIYIWTCMNGVLVFLLMIK
ncbi:unnamed protein product, partial [Owenia fusiformis]